jgi:ribosomal protein L22
MVNKTVLNINEHSSRRNQFFSVKAHHISDSKRDAQLVINEISNETVRKAKKITKLFQNDSF